MIRKRIPLCKIHSAALPLQAGGNSRALKLWAQVAGGERPEGAGSDAVGAAARGAAQSAAPAAGGRGKEHIFPLTAERLRVLGRFHTSPLARVFHGGFQKVRGGLGRPWPQGLTGLYTGCDVGGTATEFHRLPHAKVL